MKIFQNVLWRLLFFWNTLYDKPVPQCKHRIIRHVWLMSRRVWRTVSQCIRAEMSQVKTGNITGEAFCRHTVDNRLYFDNSSIAHRRHLTLMRIQRQVPHRIIWSWYTGRWLVGCYIWYSEEGPGLGHSPPRPLLAVPNVTAHPSTASVYIPITVLLYNGPLLCGLSVSIKGLTSAQWQPARYSFWMPVFVTMTMFLCYYACYHGNCTWKLLRLSVLICQDRSAVKLASCC